MQPEPDAEAIMAYLEKRKADLNLDPTDPVTVMIDSRLALLRTKLAIAARSNVQVLDRASITPINLLDQDGMLPLMTAAQYDTYDRQALLLFCHQHARYCLTTKELVDWLRPFVEDQPTIEIGAGAADLSWHLNIHATDNRMQEWPHIEALYTASGQPTIRYPNWVEPLDAIVAIEKYRPDVVVAAWVTEWLDPNLPVPPHGGNAFGVKEWEILDRGITYILIGNEKVHGHKRIMTIPHLEYQLPFLRSRAQYPEADRVYIWPGR